MDERTTDVADGVATSVGVPADEWILWYDKPARAWVEALPVGNGFLGAMVFGGEPQERIQFNEHTIWSGRPHSYVHPGAVKVLPEIRRLLAEGKQREAEELATREFMSLPLGQQRLQPFGDLLLDLDHPAPVAYRRWLDLDCGIAATEYQAGGVTYRREVFASNPDRLIFVRCTADHSGALSGTIRLASPHKDAAVSAAGAELVLRGSVEPNGVRFEARGEWVMNRKRIPAKEYEKLEDTWKPKPRPSLEWAALTRRAGYPASSGEHQIPYTDRLENVTTRSAQ